VICPRCGHEFGLEPAGGLVRGARVQVAGWGRGTVLTVTPGDVVVRMDEKTAQGFDISLRHDQVQLVPSNPEGT
jgi:hypothetical protein